jgi:hypothetical protein
MQRISRTIRPLRLLPQELNQSENNQALAEGNRYSVTFDALKKRVILEPSDESDPKNDVEDLPDGMRRVLMRSGRRKFTNEEKEKILDVVRVLVS